MSIEEENERFSRSVVEKSTKLLTRVGVDSFLTGTSIDDRSLLALKQEILAGGEIEDILISDENLQSLTGTESFDLKSEIKKNVWRAEIKKRSYTFFKWTAADSGLKRWIAVIWKEVPPNKVVVDQTFKHVAISILYGFMIVVALLAGLLVIRLYCEAAILLFRFVDEIVAIHDTMKKKLQSESK